MTELHKNKIFSLGNNTSIYMFLLITSSMKIRKVVNEPRRTLAICSLKACAICFLVFMAKQYISKELNFRLKKLENDKAFQG